MFNNGKGIPVVIHSKERMYVPEMIFGTLLTSSNYNDSEKKVTGGRNGYGAKLCNIFSTKFVVETSSKEYHKKFKQVRAFFNKLKREIVVKFLKLMKALHDINWLNCFKTNGYYFMLCFRFGLTVCKRRATRLSRSRPAKTSLA